MQADWYREQLNNDPKITSQKAIASRISKVRKAEEIISADLDSVVSDDLLMSKAVQQIKDFGDHHGNIENALRKYYLYSRGKEFPRQ